ncbi:helix-turn-helix domain-containing protein [Stackebrandtia albiflava]
MRRVADPQTLKALAHPLRVRLLGSLRTDGPQTASELGRRFDESSGSTSYHLRVLAAHDFIEEDPEQPNARDRRWRARHDYTAWRNRDFDDDPVGSEAARFMRRRQLDNVVAATERFESERAEWGPDWDDASGHSDYAVRLRPEAAAELRRRFKELVDSYADDTATSEDAEIVRIYLAAFPVRDTRY